MLQYGDLSAGKGMQVRVLVDGVTVKSVVIVVMVGVGDNKCLNPNQILL